MSIKSEGPMPRTKEDLHQIAKRRQENEVANARTAQILAKYKQFPKNLVDVFGSKKAVARARREAEELAKSDNLTD